MIMAPVDAVYSDHDMIRISGTVGVANGWVPASLTRNLMRPSNSENENFQWQSMPRNLS